MVSHKIRSSSTHMEMRNFSHKTQGGQKFTLTHWLESVLISGKEVFTWWESPGRGLETGICVLKPWHLPVSDAFIPKGTQRNEVICGETVPPASQQGRKIVQSAKTYTKYSASCLVNLMCNFWATIADILFISYSSLKDAWSWKEDWEVTQ